MKIKVYQEPYYCPDMNENFETKAVFVSTEDSTANDILAMMSKAMLLEGYHELSIIHAMEEYIEEYKLCKEMLENKEIHLDDEEEYSDGDF